MTLSVPLAPSHPLSYPKIILHQQQQQSSAVNEPTMVLAMFLVPYIAKVQSNLQQLTQIFNMEGQSVSGHCLLVCFGVAGPHGPHGVGNQQYVAVL